ncbi:MAG TPA: hypothetical protein VJ044_14720, partial [Candidatus Hodarchaeales archaeon]|nr:hypothetical protein [Candidatus Hodarchaeales archaeon]
IIVKEKGKYCVKSPKNPDWSGGCYDTKEEAEDRLDEVEMFKHMGEKLLVKVGYEKAAQNLVVLLDPSFEPFSPREHEQFMWQVAHRSGTQGFLKILDLYDRKAGEMIVANSWQEASKDLSFWERDAVVHSLVASGYPQAIGLLKVAQSDESLNITDKRSPGQRRKTPPEQQFQDRRIPAETPGVATDQSLPNWDQQFGYDQSVSHDDLLAPSIGIGKAPPIRPSASKQAQGGGGDIHPGDRVRATESADGLEDDMSGVCLEVQAKAIKVKFDTEPIARWVSKSLLTQEKAKDDILQEAEQEQDGEGGLSALMGGGGSD